MLTGLLPSGELEAHPSNRTTVLPCTSSMSYEIKFCANVSVSLDDSNRDHIARIVSLYDVCRKRDLKHVI